MIKPKCCRIIPSFASTIKIFAVLGNNIYNQLLIWLFLYTFHIYPSHFIGIIIYSKSDNIKLLPPTTISTAMRHIADTRTAM